MARYRGRLPIDKAYPGVQVSLYDTTNRRIDVTVTDMNGRFEFEDLPMGNYEARFFGRGFGPDDYMDIAVVDYFGIPGITEIVIDEEPNANNWYNEAVNWRLNVDEEDYNVRYRIVDRDIDGHNPPWVDWTPGTKTIDEQGRWTIEVESRSKSESSTIHRSSVQVNIELEDPVWLNWDAPPFEIIGGFGGIRIAWDTTNLSSFSGDEQIFVRRSDVRVDDVTDEEDFNTKTSRFGSIGFPGSDS